MIFKYKKTTRPGGKLKSVGKTIIPAEDLNAAVTRAREDEANDPRLSKLTGTSKQIAWAAKIRRDYIATNENDVSMLAVSEAEEWIYWRDDILFKPFAV